MLFLLILGFLLIILIDLPPLIIRGQIGEIRAFWAVLALSFGISLAVALRWPIPNPTDILQALFEPTARLMGLK